MSAFVKLKRFPQTLRLLIARLLYNDGLVTIFAFGGIYAAGTFGMDFGEVIAFGIALNVAAGVGSLLFARLDDVLGGKTTILVSLVALLVGTGLAVAAPDRRWLWIAGIVIGLFTGPLQSASRSLLSRFTPEAYQAEMFGVYALSGKATAFLGPLLLGIFTDMFSQRAGVAVVLGFLALGLLMMLTVNEKQGVEAAQV